MEQNFPDSGVVQYWLTKGTQKPAGFALRAPTQVGAAAFNDIRA